MKHKILILSFLIFGCSTSNSELLVNKDWTITDVEYLLTKRHAIDEVNEGTVFHFRKDGTFDFTSILELKNYTRNGTWYMDNNKLLMIQDTDTMLTKIEKLTKTELVFKWIGDDDILLFSLKSLDQRRKTTGNNGEHP